MSFHDVSGQHRAESHQVVYRTAVGTSVTSPSAVPALRKANRRLRLRRLGMDAAIGACAALLVLLSALIALTVLGMSR